MKSKRIFDGHLLILVVCIFCTSVSALPRKFQGKTEKECTQKIIEFISAEDSGNLGDFHSETDVEKVKTLWTEFRTMLQNGNNYTKHFEQGISRRIETKGGKDYLNDMLQHFINNSTNNIKDFNMTSCKIAPLFEMALKMMKHSISTKRIGSSEKFFPMIKDIIASINPEKQNFTDSPAAIYALGNLAFAAAPDFVLSILTVMTYVPDAILDQFNQEFPKAVKSFNRVEYMRALQ